MYSYKTDTTPLPGGGGGHAEKYLDPSGVNTFKRFSHRTNTSVCILPSKGGEPVRSTEGSHCCEIILPLSFFKRDAASDLVSLKLIIPCSVADPWHFGPDPDPRTRTSDERIQIRTCD
jgi:hypothetical protein